MSLAEGDAGLALVCGYIAECFDDQSWATAAHRFLQSAALDAQTSGSVAPGLFNGLAGLGFAASALSHRQTRYQRLMSSVDSALRSSLDSVTGSTAPDRELRDFDVVSGLTGMGVYLLQRTQDVDGFDQLTLVTDLLVGDATSATLPHRWWTSAAGMGDSPLRDSFPDGCINCGLAHGVPGPLAFLARAWMQGVRGPNIATAMTVSVEWLLAHQTSDAWGVNWPVAIPGGVADPRSTADASSAQHSSAKNNSAEHNSAQHESTRAAWCYGCPGVARALWLAGVALDRADWRDLSIEAMRGVCRRPAHVRQISTPGLCHGVAGLLQISLRFYHDTHDELFAEHVSALTDELLDQFDQTYATYGFRNLERGVDFDNPGFLDGAAGIAATLLAVAAGRRPSWDQVLLIA